MSYFYPKKGDVVAVCYDGKIARFVEGIVEKTKSNRILVTFTEWAGEDKHTVWFHRDRMFYGGHVKVKVSVMSKLFGRPGDWYGVYPMNWVHSLLS